MDFVTVGDIAKELGVDRDAVSYAIRKIKVQPIGRAGIVRMFPGTALATVKKFIDSKERNRKRESVNIYSNL